MGQDIVRKMAWIVKIDAINPIPDASAIEVAVIGGWNVVIKKGTFNVGDLAVYVSIDSFIPTAVAPFLTKEGHYPKVYNGVEGERLRTIKLRGTISQGLLMPLEPTCSMIESKLFEGLDVTIPLGIQKYEKPLPACLAGTARGNFPSWCRKTDQERLENFSGEEVSELVKEKYEITMKLDGSSCSVYYKDGDVGVCSRNINLKLDSDDITFVKAAKETNLITALEKYGRNIQVSSELCGPGIQGNQENFTTHKLFVFDIFDIDKQEYLSPSERLVVFEELSFLGFTGEHIPIIESDVALNEIGIVDCASSKVFVDRPSINSDMAEGCVFKRMDGKFSFKSINNKWLLKYE